MREQASRSSRAVVALEALVVSDHLVTGAVRYEPPATIGRDRFVGGAS